MQSKRPPTLSLQIGQRPPTRTVIELPTPVEEPTEDPQIQEDEEYHSSPSSSSSESRDNFLVNPDEDMAFNSDDLSKDLALLEQLRRSVHKNLRLRPIRSASGSTPSRHTPQLDASSSQSSDSPLESVLDMTTERSPSPDSVYTPASAYFTPLTEFRGTPISAFHHSRNPSLDTSARQQPQVSQPPSSTPAQGISPALLLARLSTPTRPLLIDTRPVASFLRSHLPHSVNLAIPSLILRRSRKSAGAFHTLDALRQYITTDDCKHVWDELMSGHDWDGDVIVFDEIMLEKDRHNHQATPWAVMDVVAPLLDHGGVDFLEGGFAAARKHPYLSELLMTSTDSPDDLNVGQEISAAPVVQSSTASSFKRPGRGLAQLDTIIASRSKTYPEVEQIAPSPRPLMPTAIQPWNVLEDCSSPSPAPSAIVFSRPQPPRRPSIPTLRRIDTAPPSTTLPKLQVSTGPSNSNTLAAPPLNGSGRKGRSRSPSHLNLVHSNHSSPLASAFLSPPNPSRELLPSSPGYSQPVTPRSPRTPMPHSPATARPDLDQPPSTEEPFPEFTVSTILPNFLFLGPELTLEEHVKMLMTNGVKRIINIAAECDDDHGLHLRDRFERYIHIPMRDTVEEDNITRGVQEVCKFLGESYSRRTTEV
jgi:hypothetical protein